MIIKKYVDKTEDAAVEAAQKELGSGVVIMNVRPLKRKGLAALFGARKVEVTVALEEAKDTQGALGKKSSPIREEQASPGQMFQVSSRPVREESLSAEEKVSIEKKIDNLQALMMSRFQHSEAQRQEALESGEEAVPGEDGQEKQEEKQETSEQERFIRLLYNTMLDSEVDEKYANQIVNEMDVAGKKNLPFDYILEGVYQKMILKFGKAEGITAAEGMPKIVLFMGPTGVGKTTTIAKIASRYAVEERKHVALLTADTYRIAAVDQLRTYANILEVPFRVIYSDQEAREAVEEFKDCDYIFVDTAGHSHQNAEQLAHMRQLLDIIRSAGECQTFLVLSATTKYRDLQKIITSYKEVSDYQLIFTKLDETESYGNLLNLKLFTGTPIAFVTYGQNVPNDIENFNPQKTVKEILSTKHEKSS